MKDTPVPISPACLRVYVAAAKLLRRRLGAKAPDAVALIRFELSNRDAQMVADDYLETATRRRTLRARSRRSTTVAIYRLASEAVPNLPTDPTRN